MDELIAVAAERYAGGVLGISSQGVRRIESFGTVLVAEGRRAARAGDRYLLTSITKLLTATQVHVLVHDGRLRLDDRVADHVPGFAAAGKSEVTVAHLLTHTAGIDPAANTAERPDAPDTAPTHLRAALAAGLVSAPGDRFAYSSAGFWALAEVISAVSGERYDRHLQRICAPLGMSDCRYELGVAEPERYVHRDAAGLQRQHESARRAGYPSGGAVATAADLLGFGEAMAAGLSAVAAGIRSTEIRGEWQSVPVRWGIGCELGGPSAHWPRDGLFASGASGTALWIDPVARRAAVFLTASWEADRESLARVGDLAFAALSS